MISSIFEFGETLVKEIMVPRTDMKMIQLGVSLQEITEEVREWGFSRYPVFQDNLDNIVGMLYAKDLITYIRGDKSDFDLHKILRPAYFIPENKEISELLKEFQKNKVHLAIVVDEYGGTAGLVTLEDVLEEIVGEIQDEYDQEAPEYVRDSYGAIDANAKMAIKDVNEVIGSDVIPTDGDFETLGGFIYDLTGRIPVLGESSEYGAFRFTVSEVEGQRIKRIKIERKDVSS
jgi:putative hemolysin